MHNPQHTSSCDEHLLPGSLSPSAGALEWVVDNEAKALEVLHGQSKLSSWFFIESGEGVGGQWG